jgi:hypothetical protein
MPENSIDVQRRAAGLPPIFCDPARPLTIFERTGLRGDIVIRDADGMVTKHFVPMVENGWLMYRDVFRA